MITNVSVLNGNILVKRYMEKDRGGPFSVGWIFKKMNILTNRAVKYKIE
jgi:hypothetical protein